MTYLPIETVVHMVQQKLDSGQFGTVEFVKNDGSIRKANVHFKPLSKMHGGEKTGGQLAYVSGYEVSTQKWISFDPSRVINIK